MEFTAVSDIWNRRRDEGVAYLKDLTGRKIKTARNNEELYERKDVDAVIISTADFQHALHCKEAVEAGRDAYVKKPLPKPWRTIKLPGRRWKELVKLYR